MNVKLKALVLAAVATLATSGAANAAYNNATSGDSSLFLTILDDTNQISALFDLGSSYSSFQSSSVSAPGTSFTWNVAAGDYASAWTTFLASANTSTSKFAVFAGDLTGTTAGASGFVATFNAGTKALQNNPMSTAMSRIDTYLGANTSLGNHATVENGASTAVGGAAYADQAAYFADKVGNATNFTTMGSFGSSLGVVSVTRGAGSAGSPAVFTTYGNEFGAAAFTFTSNGVLTYSVGSAPVIAVPEPESYAMMLAGLGLMGFIARRRNKFSK